MGKAHTPGRRPSLNQPGELWSLQRKAGRLSGESKRPGVEEVVKGGEASLTLPLDDSVAH